MKSIRSKLFSSYLFVIIAMIIPLAYFFFTQNIITNKYAEAINNMLVLESVPDDVNNLIGVYRKLFVDADNENLSREYVEYVSELGKTHDILNTTITNEDSRISYQGLQNLVTQIINETDDGIESARGGDLTKAAARYDSAIKKSYYLEENTAGLVLKELGVMNEFQEKMINNRKTTVIFSIALFITTSIGCLLLASLYSKEIISPVIELSDLSLEISKGNFDIEISQDLVNRKDETGTLSLSFQSMLLKLRSQITELNKSNIQIKKAQEILAQKNKQLERFNKLVVDRELKMTELKEEIMDLKKQSKT